MRFIVITLILIGFILVSCEEESVKTSIEYTVHGVVTDETTSNPIFGVEVWAEYNIGSEVFGKGSQTDSLGYFKIIDLGDVANLLVNISFHHNQYVDTSCTFVVEDSLTELDVLLKMRQYPVLYFSLAGYVKNEETEEAIDSVVIQVSYEYDSVLLHDETLTDSIGYYQFTDMVVHDSTEYLLELHHYEYVDTSFTIIIEDSLNFVDVYLLPTPVPIELNYSSIDGYVTDLSTGEYLSDAHVTFNYELWGNTIFKHASTNLDGYYEVDSLINFDQQEIRLRFYHDLYADTSVTFIVEDSLTHQNTSLRRTHYYLDDYELSVDGLIPGAIGNRWVYIDSTWYEDRVEVDTSSVEIFGVLLYDNSVWWRLSNRFPVPFLRDEFMIDDDKIYSMDYARGTGIYFNLMYISFFSDTTYTTHPDGCFTKSVCGTRPIDPIETPSGDYNGTYMFSGDNLVGQEYEVYIFPGVGIVRSCINYDALIDAWEGERLRSSSTLVDCDLILWE